ncbi:hypothetical protein [Clostridium cellulovorans]|uniref:MazG nucleotide pyrophosphohydrolase n=1 Tax=Clostridium cellulovorans (strain ATCC 35296 / DSM 3052 / OCM 3 / 743B) TaxID=573061 RepID=D9SWF1_CLOC7|nr:hypothetical protein [Clostridium cellulovorans]ADL53233.1 hypothetical protein Clocel_3557 [Clostridium cellulovorans 743B]
MKLLMYILKKNDREGIDNETLGAAGIISKLEEEFREVVIAILNYSEDRNLRNLKEIIRETFDLIQICILILWRCHKEAKEFEEPNLVQQINLEHKDKLITERAWTPLTGIEINVKE